MTLSEWEALNVRPWSKHQGSKVPWSKRMERRRARRKAVRQAVKAARR